MGYIMVYKLGAVGFGHWFERLYAGMRETDLIKLTKVAGISGIEKKMERLRAVGISPSNYYEVVPYRPMRDAFFDGLDIVHISDPNEFHATQTKQSLERGKVTVTEKTWGVNRVEFYDVVDYIKSNNYDPRAYLHLHYLHKLLTMRLEELLRKNTKRYGKVRSVSATFFETMRQEDIRRKRWLFSRKSGGLFMDWIHPFEILYYGAKASVMDLKNVELYAVNPEYGTASPTGVLSEVNLGGKFFDNATAFIRIAKGAPQNKKSVRFVFDSGSHLDLNYIDSEIEITSDKRGNWELFDNGKMIESGSPQGLTSSAFLIKDIIEMCEGRKAGLPVEDILKIFEPQWRYQEMETGKRIRTGEEEIRRFIECGVGLATESCLITL